MEGVKLTHSAICLINSYFALTHAHMHFFLMQQFHSRLCMHVKIVQHVLYWHADTLTSYQRNVLQIPLNDEVGEALQTQQVAVKIGSVRGADNDRGLPCGAGFPHCAYPLETEPKQEPSNGPGKDVLQQPPI